MTRANLPTLENLAARARAVSAEFTRATDELTAILGDAEELLCERFGEGMTCLTPLQGDMRGRYLAFTEGYLTIASDQRFRRRDLIDIPNASCKQRAQAGLSLAALLTLCEGRSQ